MSSSDESRELVPVGYEGFPGLTIGTVLRYVKGDLSHKEFVALVEVRGEPDSTEVEVKILSIEQKGADSTVFEGQLIQADGDELFYLKGVENDYR